MIGAYAILKTGCRGASRSAPAARTQSKRRTPAHPHRTKPSPSGEGGPRQRWMRGANISAPTPSSVVGTTIGRPANVEITAEEGGRAMLVPTVMRLSRRRGWRPRQPAHAGRENRSMIGEYAILKTGCRGASRSARAARTQSKRRTPAPPHRTKAFPSGEGGAKRRMMVGEQWDQIRTSIYRTISSPVIANQCAHWCGNPFPYGLQLL